MRIRTYFLFSLFLIGLSILFFKSNIFSSVWKGEEITVSTNEKGTIPHQAIRLRILANSDSVHDQWLKREVRNAIVQEIKTWSNSPKTIQQAREQISSRLPLFEKIAQNVLKKHGVSYPVKVEFGQVPFPTKLYGNKVYPAGTYEALLITLGEGKGDNWWCVLFPPLCFVDMSSGEAVPEEEESLSASIGSDHFVVHHSPKLKPKTVEVKFLLVEKWQKLFDKNG